MGDVILLGAGFSYAISSRMPLTNQLGDEVLQRVSAAGVPKPRQEMRGGYFEAWLSRLAEPQPDLSDVQNAQNATWFLLITEQIRKFVVEREYEIASTSPPWWLLRLLGVLQARKATVISLNYDTLMERALAGAGIVDWSMPAPARLGSSSILQDVPAEPYLPSGGIAFGAERAAHTFRLLKLHGSTDWHWVPGDITGATISRWSRYGQWGAPREEDAAELRRRLPGRSPFIVPPAAAKSSFYNNPVTRQLWRDASDSLAEAGQDDVVALLGYSVPATDLVMSGMLSDRLANRTAGPIDIVNPTASDVVARLIDIGLSSHVLRQYDGESPIEIYVNWLELQTQRRTHQRLMSLGTEDPDPPLVVATSEQYGAPVLSMSHSGREEDPVELAVGALGSFHQQLASQMMNNPASLVRLSQISRFPRTGLSVTYPSGEQAAIVDFVSYNKGVGSPARVLVPSAHPWSAIRG